jgi:hypothetical protein
MRFGLLIYSLTTTAIIAIFFAVHIYRVKVDWQRYLDDGGYRSKVKDLMANGLTRLKGNEFQVNSLPLILLFLAGVALGVVIFFLLKKRGVKTIWPLIFAAVIALPLFPPYTENVIPRFILALVLGNLAAFMTQGMAFFITKKRS